MTVIKHVFVLMLENRSLDHMLGFSGITGTDAVSSQSTKIQGLAGNESNGGIKVSQPADWQMPVDPCHEFLCVLEQLCGPNKPYVKGGAYPPVNCSGFVSNYISNGGASNPGEIMKCYSASQLPVLNALAREFCCLRQLVCIPAGTNLAQLVFCARGIVGWVGPQSQQSRDPEMVRRGCANQKRHHL